MVLFIILISFWIYKINSLINDTTETKITTEYIRIPMSTPPDIYYISDYNSMKGLELEHINSLQKILEWQLWYNLQVKSNYYQYSSN